MVTFPSVALILSARGWTEVGFSIIKPIAVDMIYKHIVGDFAYLAVHEMAASFAPSVNRANRIKCRAAFEGEPFISSEPEITVRIDDGVLALGQRYPAERIAVPDAPIQKHRLDDDPNQPKWDG